MSDELRDEIWDLLIRFEGIESKKIVADEIMNSIVGPALDARDARIAEALALVDEIIGKFNEPGHPGEPCIRTGWIRHGTIKAWLDKRESWRSPSATGIPTEPGSPLDVDGDVPTQVEGVAEAQRNTITLPDDWRSVIRSEASCCGDAEEVIELIESWRSPAATSDDSKIWVAVDLADPQEILSMPLGTREEVTDWLDGQYDDVDGRPEVITVGEYRRLSGRSHEEVVARAAREFRSAGSGVEVIPPEDAAKRTAESGTCGGCETDGARCPDCPPSPTTGEEAGQKRWLSDREYEVGDEPGGAS